MKEIKVHINKEAFLESIIENLTQELIDLKMNICVFIREENGNMNFESDEEVIEYLRQFED